MFPCDFARQNNEVDIYGTGGMILQDMKNLLAFLPGLKRLELVDLELDGFDGITIYVVWKVFLYQFFVLLAYKFCK